VCPADFNRLMINSNPPPVLLRRALWAGAAYFCCMAVAHFSGLKYPLLFVHDDSPFHAHQDYGLQTALIAAYLIWLLVLYATNRRRESAGSRHAHDTE